MAKLMTFAPARPLDETSPEVYDSTRMVSTLDLSWAERRAVRSLAVDYDGDDFDAA